MGNHRHIDADLQDDVDPAAWLTQSLERIANRWPNAEIDALMPWNYKA